MLNCKGGFVQTGTVFLEPLDSEKLYLTVNGLYFLKGTSFPFWVNASFKVAMLFPRLYPEKGAPVGKLLRSL